MQFSLLLSIKGRYMVEGKKQNFVDIMAATFGPVLLQYYFIVLVLVVFNISSNVYSNSIIKNLPGFRGDLPFKLETGYIGVGEKEDVQLFYYFVESERNPKHDPLLIWIPGGPGCSCLRGVFYEMGPFTFDYEIAPENKPGLKLNPYSWTKVANVIFLDTPVIGAGFSYGKTSEACKSSDTLQSNHTYNFLRKWLNDHPKFISNPLYIAGVSYAGIPIPIITQEIYNGNEAGNEPQMNIKGYLIGNPLTDRDIDFNSRIPYANHFALLSDQLFESVKRNCHGDYINVNPNNELCANDLNEVNECLKYIQEHNILEPSCGEERIGEAPSIRRSHGRYPKNNNPINPLRLPRLHHLQCREETYDYYPVWANDEAVQRALHIREGTVKKWEACNTDHYEFGKNDTATYSYDVSSSIAYYRNLTDKNCRALIYSGDHDLIFPYLGTQKWIQTLGLNIESTWAPWYVEDEVAGYRTTYSHNDYSLTHATVKGAGHVAPEYKPKECLAMVDRWFGHFPL